MFSCGNISWIERKREWEKEKEAMKSSWSFGTVVMHAYVWEGRQKQKELCMRVSVAMPFLVASLMWVRFSLMNGIAEFRPTRRTYSQNNKFGDRSGWAHTFLTRTWALPRTGQDRRQKRSTPYPSLHGPTHFQHGRFDGGVKCICVVLCMVWKGEKKYPQNPIAHIAQPKELQDRIQIPHTPELVFKFWESSATPYLYTNIEGTNCHSPLSRKKNKVEGDIHHGLELGLILADQSSW